MSGLLGIAFVVLKLTGAIGWSWWWVTLPFWGVAALLLLVALVCFVMAGVQWLCSTPDDRARMKAARALESFARGFRRHL